MSSFDSSQPWVINADAILSARCFLAPKASLCESVAGKMRCAARIVRAPNSISASFLVLTRVGPMLKSRSTGVLETIGGALVKGSDCLSMSAQGFVDVDRPYRCPGCSEMELGESELGLSSKASGELGALRVRQSGVSEFK